MVEKNEFDEFSEEEFKQEDEVIKTPLDTTGEIELNPGDFEQYTYLKNPEVGESVVLDIKRIVKKKGRELENKTNGKKFWTGLEDKNDKRVETIIETVNGERFGITSWGLYFNLFGKESAFMKKAKELGKYEGIKIKITHNFNGKDATADPKDLMKLRDFKTLKDAEVHKQKVGKAMKEGTIYSVEIL